MFHITTARLKLRPLQISDAEALFTIRQHPDVARFVSQSVTLEEETARLRQQIEVYYPTHGLGFLAATLRTDDRLIGRCGFLAQEIEGQIETEVAYLLGREHWGHGYATEAARALVAFAFSELGRARVISLIHPDNLRSLAVAERAGLSFDRDVIFKEERIGLYAKQAAHDS